VLDAFIRSHMPHTPQRSWIERTAVRLGLIPDTDRHVEPPGADGPGPAGVLHRFPAPDGWSDVVEHDPRQWPHRLDPRHYRLVPTTCFNCESACGLLAYVDKQSGRIRKLEGNPLHPGSRGKNCAKGPATINQVNDPDRILTPMKRAGPRGSGLWRAASWDEVLADIGGRLRKALREDRRDEVVYHVGRPGAEGFMDRVLRAWGVDGHNSHTNICSSGARLGYALWSGYDRPSPDYANARFILALNAHLESGHFFNPHAQRISEGIKGGAKLAVVDPRLSNTASMAHYWLPTVPGTEAALLLAMARVILEENRFDRAFMERWVNWEASLDAAEHWEGNSESIGVPPARDSDLSNGAATDAAESTRRRDADAPRFDDFIAALKRHYAPFTPEFAERECGVPAGTIVEIARQIADAGSRFCSHTWRGAASAHLGGWQVSRCLFLLHALTGSVGTPGGVSPSAWNKYKAHLINMPPPQDHWNELHWPREFPLAHYELSFLLPHFLKEGRGKIDVYFTRVFNPVWTYPDGFSWIEALRDESKIGLHVALTPTWNETAFYADYVLPMGHGPERHDLNTYETHNGTWVAFRQPVLRAHARAEGRDVRDTRDVNPGQVWEEDEFWIALTWAIDPDGSLGIRRWFESQRPAQGSDQEDARMLTVDEYYAHIFERVPGLPEKARQAGLTPLDFMRRFGAFEVSRKDYLRHERRLGGSELSDTTCGEDSVVRSRSGAPLGIRMQRDGQWDVVEGFATPSRKLEFYSRTMVDWGWPECALPAYIRSHIWEGTGFAGEGSGIGEQGSGKANADDFCLLPTFRLPTLIHTRSGAAKWLNEISQRNPVWIHTSDARRLGVRTGDLVRVITRIGHFVDKCWVTEGIRPGVVACSHHLGRWRRRGDPPNSRWSSSVVAILEPAPGQWTLRTEAGPGPFESADPDSRRIWWRDGGVPQNLTFPVHPDPISGMHCWHQRVRVEKAQDGDQSGDVFVDTNKSMAVYREWMRLTRVEPVRRHGLRRPLWLNRPRRPPAPADAGRD
jgi:anaerobic selenocysteine-containing dehydrogenase